MIVYHLPEPVLLNRKAGVVLALIVILIAAYGLLHFAPGVMQSLTGRSPPVVLAPDDGSAQPIGPGAAYLRGAHWFGEGWAVNFWNTRLTESAAEDFAQIRADGFNTVVLVVPWPGFVNAPKIGALKESRVAQLEQVLDLAADAGLNVVLRVGYAHDSSVPLSGRWLMRLWYEEPVREGWLEHIADLWQIVKQRPHVRFAFISWEDLWGITRLGNGNAQERVLNADRSGYRAWLQKYSDLETVRERYGVDFRDWNEVPVPDRMEPAYGLFLDFIDHAWIERFFKPAQAVFPTMSMEIRIDSDPVWNGPGDLAYWHSHELAWDLPGAPWTTVYWSPAMGSSNVGNTLTPERAVELLEFQMRRLRAVTGNRPIFIDQFLVEDFTPGFELNDRLARDQVDEFLELATPVLRTLTHGYALWAWRDYEHNAVPSPDFSDPEGNWEWSSGAQTDAPHFLLSKGQSLQRSFGIDEFHAPGGPEVAQLCFSALPDEDAAPDLQVYSNTLTERTLLDVSGDGKDCVEVPLTPRTTVSVEALSDLNLINASFSGFTQPIGIHDVDGTAKPVAQSWRAMNRALPMAEPAPFEPFDDQWMGKTLSSRARISVQDAPLQVSFDTRLPADWPFEPELRIEAQGKLLGFASCRDDTRHEIAVPPGTLEAGSTEFILTVSRTFRPDGDQRRLGCQVSDVSVEVAE